LPIGASVNFSKTKLSHEIRNVGIRAVNSWSIKTHTHTHLKAAQAAIITAYVLAGLINVKVIKPKGSECSLAEVNCPL